MSCTMRVRIWKSIALFLQPVNTCGALLGSNESVFGVCEYQLISLKRTVGLWQILSCGTAEAYRHTLHENVDGTKWDDWCCPVKVPSLSVPTQSLLNNQFPTVFVGQEICIVLQAEPSGLPRPPMESDENLIGKPEMLLSHAVRQWARNLMMISRG